MGRNYHRQAVNNSRSYAYVAQNYKEKVLAFVSPLESSNHISYRVLEEELLRFERAYVERVSNPG